MSEVYFSSLTPITNIGVSSLEGPVITTFFAPALMWPSAFSAVRKIPVASATYSAPTAPQLRRRDLQGHPAFNKLNVRSGQPRFFRDLPLGLCQWCGIFPVAADGGPTALVAANLIAPSHQQYLACMTQKRSDYFTPLQVVACSYVTLPLIPKKNILDMSTVAAPNKKRCLERP